MYDGLAPSAKGERQRYYTQNMLYDAGSLTSVTLKKSKHREGGLILQFGQGDLRRKHVLPVRERRHGRARSGLTYPQRDEEHIRRGTSGRNDSGGGLPRKQAEDPPRTARCVAEIVWHPGGAPVTWAVFQGIRGRLDLEEARGSAILLSECHS